jgi:hypothetical protein
MAIRRFDPGSVKASTPVSDALYRDTSPPFRLEDDYMGTRGYEDKARIRAHERRLDPLTGEPREGSYPVDFTTASGWDEGPAGIDPTKMDDIDYVLGKTAEHDRLAYERDAFESAYRTPSIEKRMDSYTGEMVDMPVGLRSGDGRMWSRGKLLEPTTEEEYMAIYEPEKLYDGGTTISRERVSDPFAMDYKTFRDFTPDGYGVY